MSVAYNPKIVTNNLILCVDAANPKSYSGSGTTWIDLTNNYNGTLVSSPAYSTANGGALVFTGTEGVTFTSPTLADQMSFEVYVTLNPTANTNSWVGGKEGCYRMLYSTTSFAWVCATANNAWYTTGTAISSSTAATSGTYHVVGTYDGSNLKIYVNGILQSTGAAISGNVVTNGATYALIRSGASGIANGIGSVYTHRTYNRALTAAEVQQNFNALRGRFGI